MFPRPAAAATSLSSSSSSSRCSSSPSKFVETALCATGPLALSYVHHGLKWNIRDHLLSLIREFPSLEPSTDHFTHNDGTTVRLLNARGALPLPHSPPFPPTAVELTIWLHQNYPFAPPIVYLSTASAAAVGRGHPFVNPSGAATTPYLSTWQYPNSNLLDLARNLVHVFACYPTFGTGADLRPTRRTAVVGGALVSRREAMDHLYASLSTEMAEFRAQVEEDVTTLVSIQTELRKRARALDRAQGELQMEKKSLGRLVADTKERADVLRNWLRANRAVPPAGDEPGPEPEEAFDVGDDGRSRRLLDSEAACHAIDDVIRAADDALGEGAVPFVAYLRQVRNLTREQFFHTAMSTKLQALLRSPAPGVDQFDSEVPLQVRRCASPTI